jgi:decaprenyl-diphosphate synthase subunit 2
MVSRNGLIHWKTLHLDCIRFTNPISFTFSRGFSVSSQICQNNWVKAVSNAEKVVGFPTSFLSLRSVANDEISNIAVYLKKLIGTGHPLIATAK